MANLRISISVLFQRLIWIGLLLICVTWLFYSGYIVDPLTALSAQIHNHSSAAKTYTAARLDLNDLSDDSKEEDTTTAPLDDCSPSSAGFGYLGHQAVTVSGKQCQAWNSQMPHSHSFNNSALFPDETLDDAGAYCRNPDGKKGVWCITQDNETVWEYCNVPSCSAYPECKLTIQGQEYRGHVHVSRSKRNCLKWNEISSQRQLSFSVDSLESNFCRNPDGKPIGPWCYIGSDKWEYCRIAFCKPSAYCKQTQLGKEYVGTVSVTNDGRQCQKWSSQHPHKHQFLDPKQFPDASLKDAVNYCRNPNSNPEGLWCFTKDPEVKMGLCDIPMCEDCKISKKGTEYFGNISTTLDMKKCIPWRMVTFDDHMNSRNFPDKSVGDALNFCRNPDRKKEGPWCYFSNQYHHWSYCDVPFCSGRKTETTFKRRLAKHVLHIGIDGLHPCFVNSKTQAPNIMKRVAAAGTYSLTKGRTGTRSVSGPCWISILCGLPAEASSAGEWNWRPSWLGFKHPGTPVTGNTVSPPCIWKEIKSQDAGIRTAAFTTWDWLLYLTNYGIPGSVDYDVFYNNSQLHELSLSCDNSSFHHASIYLKELFNTAESSFTFVYLNTLDEYGHDYSWCSPKYLELVDIADAFVGKLLDIVESANMNDDVMVVINSDHGGGSKTHFNKTDLTLRDDNLISLLFMRGPGIKRNHSLQRWFHTVDVSPTIMEALGLKPNPLWMGKVIWEAFDSKFINKN